MARKATANAAPPAPAPVVAAASVAPSPVIFATYHEAAAMMVSTLASLTPHQALDRLRAIYATLPPGTARRAVLSARIAILRDNLPAQIILPVAAPPPEPKPAPAPKPTPKAGALSTLALEDAARLLMAATEDDDDTPPPAKTPPVAQVADLFAAMAADDDDGNDETGTAAADFGFDDADVASLPDSAATDDALPSPPVVDVSGFDDRDGDDDLAALAALAPPPKPKSAKAKAAKAKTADTPDAEAALDPEPTFRPTPPSTAAVAVDTSALLADLAILADDGDDVTALPAPAKPAKGKKAKSAATLTSDLGAAFAAMADTSDDAPLAPSADLVLAVADRFSGLGDDSTESLPPVKPAPRRKTQGGMSDTDVAASLAALMGGGAPQMSTPPAMLGPEVSNRLTALEAAFAEDAMPKPNRKAPTDLSAISATFAALDKDED